jgi:hypothetical protein
MENVYCTWGVCFAPLSTTDYVKIFGFSEFLAALALLVVLFTISDVRSKFRTAIVPGDLYLATFGVMIAVGFLTLATEVWVAQKWYVPQSLWVTTTTWQAALGLMFFGAFATWMYYAFIRPPVFYRRNAKRYADTLFRYVVKANDDDLKVLAHEIARSAPNLVRLAKPSTNSVDPAKSKSKSISKRKHTPDQYAHDLLFLIANRKLCRHIVQSSPVTVAVFLDAANEEDGAWAPIGQFATNVSIEAFANKESFVYQEEERYDSGLIGHLKPVTQALYGRYKLIERLAVRGSFPFDIPYEETNAWNGAHWRAYYRVSLLLFKDYLKVTGGRAESQALRQIFENASLKHVHESYDGEEVYNSSAYRRLDSAVQFITQAISLVEMHGGPPDSPRPKDTFKRESIYDHLAHLMFDACVHVAGIKRKDFTSWSIQHNAVWSNFFGFEQSATWRIVRRRLVHLIADEIGKVPTLPHFVNVPLLGYCANMMGLKQITKIEPANRDWRGLHRLVLWLIRKHYASLLSKNVRLAEAMLVGKLTFDPITFKVVKTYEANLHEVAPTDSLPIDGAFRKVAVRRLQKKQL